jgi:hypothetical protein
MRVRLAATASVLTDQCVIDPNLILQLQLSADSSAKG